MTTIQIKVPNWLDYFFACPLMLYRWLHYGYSYRRIYLGECEWTILDAEDYYRLNNFKWSAAGDDERMYAVRIIKKTLASRVKPMFLHREIMNAPKGLVVDHKNGDPLDNRRANLRLATHSQNMHNRRKTRSKTSSRFIGVVLDKRRGKWLARINYQGKLIYLGSFDSEIDAAKAYNDGAVKYHGEFARLNFPNLTAEYAENAEKT